MNRLVSELLFPPLRQVSVSLSGHVEIQLGVSPFFLAGWFYGQTAGSRGLPGVLSLHVREEHPQRFPYCGSGLHEQTAGCQQTQPRPPPLQETPTPPQQDRSPLLLVQQREVQELRHHVNTAERGWGQGQAFCRYSSGGGWSWVCRGKRAMMWILTRLLSALQHPPKKNLSDWEVLITSTQSRQWKSV